MTENFVPVALNLYRIRAAKDAAGDLFRSLNRQKPQYQGLYLVAPDGKLLASHQDFQSEKTWTQEVLRTIDLALTSFGEVAPREVKRVDPLPDRGQGVRPDGRINLALYVRRVYNRRLEGMGVIDSITLSAEDWAALSPPEPLQGKIWTLPESVTRQFSRCLSPDSDQSTMPRPSELTEARLNGTVQSVSQGRATLVYQGRLVAERTYLGKVSRMEARLSGVGTFDVRAGQLLTFQLVADGTYQMAPPYDKERQPIVAAIEWRRDRLAR